MEKLYVIVNEENKIMDKFGSSATGQAVYKTLNGAKSRIGLYEKDCRIVEYISVEDVVKAENEERRLMKLWD